MVQVRCAVLPPSNLGGHVAQCWPIRPEGKLAVSLRPSLLWSYTGTFEGISYFLPLNNCMKMRCLELLQPSCDHKDERPRAKAKSSGWETDRWQDPRSLMIFSTERNYPGAALSLSFLFCGLNISDVVQRLNDLLLVFCNLTSPGAACFQRSEVHSPSSQAPELWRPLFVATPFHLNSPSDQSYLLSHSQLFIPQEFPSKLYSASLHLRISSQGA